MYIYIIFHFIASQGSIEQFHIQICVVPSYFSSDAIFMQYWNYLLMDVVKR